MHVELLRLKELIKTVLLIKLGFFAAISCAYLENSPASLLAGFSHVVRPGDEEQVLLLNFDF